jgi:hypothetical protein
LIYFKYISDLPTSFLLNYKNSKEWPLEKITKTGVIDIIGVEWLFLEITN